MPLSRDFRETVMEELRDPAYRRAFLREAINALLRDDLETAKPSLRAYINGTMGFTRAGEDLGRSPKSLMRMLGPDGNPQPRTCSTSSRTFKRPKAQPGRWWKRWRRDIWKPGFRQRTDAGRPFARPPVHLKRTFKAFRGCTLSRHGPQK